MNIPLGKRAVINRALIMPENDPRYAPFKEGKTKTTFTRQTVNSAELSLLSHEYDVFFRRIENLNLLFTGAGAIFAITTAAGVSVVTMGVGIIPIITLVSFVPLIGRCAQLFPAQWFKTSELEYISGACLSMVANMSDDLINLKKFYKIVDDYNTDKSSVKIPECSQPKALYAPVEKNLYKFMFILLNAMDFNTKRDDLGPLHYTFLAGLFDYCDFKNSRFKVVDGKAEETDEEKNGKSFKYRYTYSKECGYSEWQEDNISHEKYGKSNYAKSCNNLNDTIVRLLEHKFLGAKDVLNEMLTAKMDPPLKPETKSKIENFLKDNTDKFSSSNAASRFGIKFKTTLFGAPNQCYREMLREYTIMTANWSMITSKYALQYNYFILMVGADTYKTKLGLIDQKIEPAVKQINKANVEITDNVDARIGATLTKETNATPGSGINITDLEALKQVAGVDDASVVSNLTDNYSGSSSGNNSRSNSGDNTYPLNAQQVNPEVNTDVNKEGGKRKSKRHRKRANKTKKYKRR